MTGQRYTQRHWSGSHDTKTQTCSQKRSATYEAPPVLGTYTGEWEGVVEVVTDVFNF